MSTAERLNHPASVHSSEPSVATGWQERASAAATPEEVIAGIERAPQSRLSAKDLAFASAMAARFIPGTAHIPAGDSETVARVEAVIRDAFPALIQPWIAALRALDLAALKKTRRRFTSLSVAEADALLAEWELDPVMRAPVNLLGTLFKFMHFDIPRVYRALGGTKAYKPTRSLEQPRWLPQIVEARTFADNDLECDVVVVGTGAGGAIVGRELAEAGHAVVFVEEGAHYRRDAFIGSSVHAHKTFYRSGFAVGNAPMPTFMGKLVGGSTAINTGTSLRAPSWVHQRWASTLGSDFGEERMTERYREVEALIGVQTTDRRFIGPIAKVFDDGCDQLGWSHGAMPRNATGCEGTGFCDFGCPSDARRSTNLSVLPKALEKGAMVLTGLRADKVVREDGRAVGIQGQVVGSNKTITVRAKRVVFAGGAIPSTLFLMKNKLGRTSRELGRNLSLHPSGGMSALFDSDINPHRHVPQGWMCDEFLGDGLLISAAQADMNMAGLLFPVMGSRLMEALEQYPRMASFGILAADSKARGRVLGEYQGEPIITYNLAREDIDRLHRGMIRVAQMSFAAGAKAVYPSLVGGRPIRSQAELAAFSARRLDASELGLTSYHPLGTVKMGADPKASVIGLNHEVHDCKGMYVIDGGAVQGPLGVNPQITIMAYALRAARLLAAELS